jgi:5-methyltetrahydrofolate--homocysteine methyltransferase
LSARVLRNLNDAVVVGDVQEARSLARQVLSKGIRVSEAMDILMKAMEAVDEKYERKEYFVIDVAAAAAAMREAFKIFKPYLEVQPAMVKGKIVIGSLKGNIQGIGKDIVAASLQSAGFQVVDLGEDVAPESFVRAAVREKAQVIAVSVSMEETIPYLKDVAEILRREKLRERIKVVIGGNAVSEEIRTDYDLDAYAATAQECVEKVEALLRQKIL